MIGKDAIGEVNKVSDSIVKEAACRMKPGKSDVSGGYTSYALLNALNFLFDCLAAFTRAFLTHGTVTKTLLVCSLLPLLKSLKDLETHGQCYSPSLG